MHGLKEDHDSTRSMLEKDICLGVVCTYVESTALVETCIVYHMIRAGSDVKCSRKYHLPFE